MSHGENTAALKADDTNHMSHNSDPCSDLR